MWFRRKVKHGQKIGRTLGYPTLNFNVGNFGQSYEPGVYASELKIGGKIYKGALYFGPKPGSPNHVLEVFVLGYDSHSYDQFVSFRIGKKIRPPMTFESFKELRMQIEKDVEAVK